MKFSSQEYWSGLPFPSPGDFPDLGIKPTFPVSPVLAGRFFTTEPPGKPLGRDTWFIPPKSPLYPRVAVAVQLLSLVQPFVTPYCSTQTSCPSLSPGARSNSCRVSDIIQPSHPLSSPSPLALSLSQCQDLFQWVDSSHQVAKVVELQLQHQSFQWMFRVGFF